MPHIEAGLRTDPPVSVPRAAGTKPAATATPDPLEDPPEKWSRCQAFRAGGQGKSKDGPPMANSWVASLPTRTPPAACSRCVTTASVRARLSARILEWAVVGTPATVEQGIRRMGELE